MSETVTVTDAVEVLAVSGVPPIAPVVESMLNPDGKPVALYLSIPDPPDGLIVVIASPTFSEPGAVYVGAVGAVRSILRVRRTALGEVNPVLEADTDTVHARAGEVGRPRRHAHGPPGGAAVRGRGRRESGRADLHRDADTGFRAGVAADAEPRRLLGNVHRVVTGQSPRRSTAEWEPACTVTVNVAVARV